MSVFGVGLDLLDISRMENKLEDGRFMNRIYTAGEKAYILSRGKFSASSAAGIFCAKEAFMKAVGEGLAVPL
jgi:holo-[acyl-carrier protein] synthase